MTDEHFAVEVCAAFAVSLETAIVNENAEDVLNGERHCHPKGEIERGERRGRGHPNALSSVLLTHIPKKRKRALVRKRYIIVERDPADERKRKKTKERKTISLTLTLN
jgi:hypothetical protein